MGSEQVADRGKLERREQRAEEAQTVVRVGSEGGHSPIHGDCRRATVACRGGSRPCTYRLCHRGSRRASGAYRGRRTCENKACRGH